MRQKEPDFVGARWSFVNKTASAARASLTLAALRLLDVLKAFGLFARAARDWHSSGSIQLLGDPSEVWLKQLVTVAKQRLGTTRVTLLGPREVRARLTKIVADQGLEIAQEREPLTFLVDSPTLR